MGDIQLILENAIKSEMDINPTDFRNYNAILIIQDLFDKSVTYELTRLLFQDMGFSKVAFLQVDNHRSRLTVGIGCCHLRSRFIECLRG